MSITLVLRHLGPGTHPSGTPQSVHGKAGLAVHEDAPVYAPVYEDKGGIVPCVNYQPKEEDLQRAWDVAREQIEQNWAEHDEATPEDWENKALINLGKWMKKFKPSIQVPLESAFKVVSDGRFKTQFETGKTSSGVLDTNARAVVEEEVMGVPRDVDPINRPVYGQLRPPGSITDLYGDIEFVLKDSVRARCTYTVGDSMGGFGGRSHVAAPLGQPSLETMSDLSAEDASCLYWDSPEEYMHNGEQYVEVQVHGGLTLSDVESINILNANYKFPLNYDAKMRLAKKVAALGIKVNVPRGVLGKARWDKDWKAAGGA